MKLDVGRTIASSGAPQRKILMVISDGAPVDDSTCPSTPATISSATCGRVIEEIEEKSDVELTAIGIGHDGHALLPQSGHHRRTRNSWVAHEPISCSGHAPPNCSASTMVTALR